MATQKADFLQGTLEMLILKALSLGPLHGYGIIQRINQMSGETAHRRARLALSRAISHRAEGLGLVEVGRKRNRSPGKVLFVNEGGSTPTRSGRSQLGSTCSCHHQDAAGHISG